MRRLLRCIGEMPVLGRAEVATLDLAPEDMGNLEVGDIIVFENHQITKTPSGIQGSVFIRSHWYLWILLLLAAVFLRSQMVRHPRLVLKLERAKLRIPLAKTIWVESAMSLYSRTLSLLLQAGVPLLAGVGLAIQAIPNKYLASRASILPGEIKNGESLSEAMAKATIFPPLALDMVRIGETSANLGGMLREVADVFDQSIQALIDTFVSLIEPIIIILMGLLVAGMLLAVYLPIFNIIKVAR